MTSFGNRHAKTFWPSELNVTWKSNIYKSEDEEGKVDSTNNTEEKSIRKSEYWQKKIIQNHIQTWMSLVYIRDWILFQDLPNEYSFQN